MKAAVVVFPGSNRDRDVRGAAPAGARVDHGLARATPSSARHRPGRPARRLLLRRLPALRRHRALLAVMDAVRPQAAQGRLVLGICNGFQILCEAGLLPGVAHAQRESALHVPLADLSRRADTAFTSRYASGQAILRLPIAHGEGNYFADPGRLRASRPRTASSSATRPRGRGHGGRQPQRLARKHRRHHSTKGATCSA